MLFSYRFGMFAYGDMQIDMNDVIVYMAVVQDWSMILLSVIVILRLSNDLPLPVSFHHRGRQWHINLVESREDQYDWSNRNLDLKSMYRDQRSLIESGQESVYGKFDLPIKILKENCEDTARGAAPSNPAGGDPLDPP